MVDLNKFVVLIVYKFSEMASVTQHETVMEFAVRMTSRDDEMLVRSKLEGIRGVKEFKIDLKEETVLVATELSSFEIQQLLESTGEVVCLFVCLYDFLRCNQPVYSGHLYITDILTCPSGGCFVLRH